MYLSSRTALVDMARVYLGMSRGNAMLKTLVYAIEHDFRALLNWKNRRVKPVPEDAVKDKYGTFDAPNILLRDRCVALVRGKHLTGKHKWWSWWCLRRW